MAKFALPCIACGNELVNVDAEVETNQPYNGTAFTSHGHYGSTIYDPMDGHYLELNVCDACLALHHNRVMEGRNYRLIIEEGSVTGTEPIKPPWKLVHWQPTKDEIDHALSTTIEERGLYPVDAKDDEDGTTE